MTDLPPPSLLAHRPRLTSSRPLVLPPSRSPAPIIKYTTTFSANASASSATTSRAVSASPTLPRPPSAEGTRSTRTAGVPAPRDSSLSDRPVMSAPPTRPTTCLHFPASAFPATNSSTATAPSPTCLLPPPPSPLPPPALSTSNWSTTSASAKPGST